MAVSGDHWPGDVEKPPCSSTLFETQEIQFGYAMLLVGIDYETFWDRYVWHHFRTLVDTGQAEHTQIVRVRSEKTGRLMTFMRDSGLPGDRFVGQHPDAPYIELVLKEYQPS